MRALCGAIITAGALIGLGLTATGIGTRYQALSTADTQGHIMIRDVNGDNITRGTPGTGNAILWLKLSDMDRGLTAILYTLLLGTAIGLATTFIGLAYHHYRRHHESLRNHHEGVGARVG
jgi:hypothetical protein